MLLSGGSWLKWGGGGATGFTDPGGNGGLDMKGAAFAGLAVSRTSLLIYGTDLTSSNALFNGLLCNSSGFLWGERALEVTITLSGDLRLKWSSVQGE